VKILALDTATENCSAALLVDGTLLTREEELARGHADRILPMIDELLVEARTVLAELDAIAFGRGPGSFTGVRLAATVTQGLAFGAGLKVVPISDLQAVAERAFRMDAGLARVVVCNDARMNEVYWGCYERGADGLARLEGEEHVSKPNEVRLPANWTTATAVGRGFIVHSQTLRAALPNVAVHSSVTMPSNVAVPPNVTVGTAVVTPSLHLLLPRAAEIALLAVPAKRLPPEAALPVYLRDNVAHVAHPPKGPG
jgi:tRNA threonylcarbamoyladenosine biosynthesis protein TsaB